MKDTYLEENAFQDPSVVRKSYRSHGLGLDIYIRINNIIDKISFVLYFSWIKK